MAKNEEATGGADLGTNGELILSHRGRIYVASTAAGPAFEGGRISMGMRAGRGAIDQVTLAKETVGIHVIGGGAPKGLCGSGLIDAVACGLDLGIIESSGRLRPPEPWTLSGTVTLTQADVREVQLAKGAIAAGLQILLKTARLRLVELERFYLAGAFGHALSAESAERIGLLPFSPSRVATVGNAALRGAKMCLFSPKGGRKLWQSLLPHIEHVSLAASPSFLDLFTEAMAFKKATVI